MQLERTIRPLKDANKEALRPAALSFDGDALIVAHHRRRTVYRYTLDDRKWTPLFDMHGEPDVHRSSFTPDGRTLLVCHDEAVHAYDVAEGRLRARFAEGMMTHVGYYTVIDDDTVLLTHPLPERALSLYDLRTGAKRWTMSTNPQDSGGVASTGDGFALVADGQLLWYSCDGPTLRDAFEAPRWLSLWSPYGLEAGYVIGTLKLTESTLTAYDRARRGWSATLQVAFPLVGLGDGRVVVAERTGDVRLLSIGDGSELARVTLKGVVLRCCALSADRSRLAIAGGKDNVDIISLPR